MPPHEITSIRVSIVVRDDIHTYGAGIAENVTLLLENETPLGEWLRGLIDDDRVVMYESTQSGHAFVIDDIAEIKFEMSCDGQTKIMVFIRPEKIINLLTARDCTIGEWLRAFRDLEPENN
jgi:hypothetical protein